jgi:hypothetical protein
MCSVPAVYYIILILKSWRQVEVGIMYRSTGKNVAYTVASLNLTVDFGFRNKSTDGDKPTTAQEATTRATGNEPCQSAAKHSADFQWRGR